MRSPGTEDMSESENPLLDGWEPASLIFMLNSFLSITDALLPLKSRMFSKSQIMVV